MTDPSSSAETAGERKATASLEAATPSVAPAQGPPAHQPRIQLDLMLRMGELAVFLVAMVGAVALGLGITAYFRDHSYIGAYLLAYGGFRIADLLVREDQHVTPTHDTLMWRVANQLPLLLIFAAAPFERTYFYGGEAPRWMGALALLLELTGLWLALGARIQLAFFSFEHHEDGVRHTLVRNGFYRFVRHPTYAGVSLAFVAWPIAYAAPITLVLIVVLGGLYVGKLIREEEAHLHSHFGDEYARYCEDTRRMIPRMW